MSTNSSWNVEINPYHKGDGKKSVVIVISNKRQPGEACVTVRPVTLTLILYVFSVTASTIPNFTNVTARFHLCKLVTD